MRLEEWLFLYPEGRHVFLNPRMVSSTRVFRGRSKASDFTMAIRDSGKGWINDDSKQVYSESMHKSRI